MLLHAAPHYAIEQPLQRDKSQVMFLSGGLWSLVVVDVLCVVIVLRLLFSDREEVLLYVPQRNQFRLRVGRRRYVPSGQVRRRPTDAQRQSRVTLLLVRRFQRYSTLQVGSVHLR